MAKFTATVPLNIRLPGGFEAIGVAGTTHRIPDALYEEFVRDQVPLIPGGVTWVTQDEESAIAGFDPSTKYDKTGGTISGAVTITGALVAQAAVTATGAAVLQSTLSVVGTTRAAAIIASAITATTGRFLGSPFWDVKGMGAVGDGSTDDTAAIQAAFDSCHAAGGGTVFFPAGTYKFTSMLQMPYPASIVGEGMYVSFLSYNGVSASTAMRFKNYATVAQRNSMYFHGFTLSNDIAATSVTAMDLKGMCRSQVDHVRWKSFYDGLIIDASYGTTVGAWWNTISNCESGAMANRCIVFTGAGINGGKANENRVINSAIEGATVANIDVVWGDHILIEKCDLTSGGGGIGVRSADWMTVIRDCRFEGNTTAIQFNSTSGSVQPQNIVDGCLFSGNTTAIDIEGTSQIVSVGTNLYTGVTTRITDNGMANASHMSGYGMGAPKLQPLYFSISNITASQTDVVVPPAGFDSSNTLLYVGRPYQIRGITYRGSGTITAGTLTVKPTIGGTTSSTLSLTPSSSNTSGAWQGMNKDTDTGSSGIGVKYSTTGSFLPTGTDDLNIIVWIEFTD